MGSDEKRLIATGGFTGSFWAIVIGFKLAFPDMIVPFGWALAIICVGLLGLLATVIFAGRAFIWKPRQHESRERDIVRIMGDQINQTHSGSGHNIGKLEVGPRQIEMTPAVMNDVAEAIRAKWGTERKVVVEGASEGSWKMAERLRDHLKAGGFTVDDEIIRTLMRMGDQEAPIEAGLQEDGSILVSIDKKVLV